MAVCMFNAAERAASVVQQINVVKMNIVCDWQVSVICLLWALWML